MAHADQIVSHTCHAHPDFTNRNLRLRIWLDSPLLSSDVLDFIGEAGDLRPKGSRVVNLHHRDGID